MKRKFQAVKGTRDILPPESALWNRVEHTARQVFAAYNFHEIRPPIFEETELFARSVGLDTDIVSKEMYTFTDPPLLSLGLFKKFKKQFHILGPDKTETILFLKETLKKYVIAQSLTLRPEATAQVCRAYIEHGMHTWPSPVKLYYIGPMFRRERPQKGRFRQFYQIGAEVLGPSDHPAIDAEVIELVMVFLERCGLKGATLYVNSIGCGECRPKYVELLRQELQKVKDKLGPDSQRRIETNPLRVLDSKLEEEQPIIAKLPSILDHLCDGCRDHFAKVQQELKDRGLAYEINWRLVRGLDYYMRTTFEITALGLGAQNAVCGGGRYDSLVELLGGSRDVKGIGWALGTDRLVLALQNQGLTVQTRIDVLIAWKDEAAYAQARSLARMLRDVGLAVELPVKPMQPREGLGLASKLGIPIGVVIGPDEVSASVYSVKFLSEGEQVSISHDQASRIGRLLLLRSLLEKRLRELASMYGIEHKNLTVTDVTAKLLMSQIIPSQLNMPITGAMQSFAKAAYGQQLSDSEMTEAVAMALFALHQLSQGHGQRLFPLTE